MHPHRIPGSDVNLGLAAAFVAALTLLLVSADASTPDTPDQWQEARHEVQQKQLPADAALPPVEIRIRTDACDGAVS